MFLPPGVSKYESIQVNLIDLDKFLDTLHQDFFTGYCKFTTDSHGIVLLFERGTPQRAFQCGDKNILLPVSTACEKCTASEEVKAVVLPSVLVNMMCRLLFCVPRYQNLSTAFTDFKTLLVTLEDEKFTGYIEINIGKSVHYLSLEKGGPRAAYYVHSPKNELITGADALEALFNNIKRGAHINVYPLEGVSLAAPFLHISKRLFSAYSELKGPILTKKFWEKLSQCTRGTAYVNVGNGEFILENFPTDPRVQEKILVPIMQCQIKLYSDELGAKKVKELYVNLVEKLKSPLKEVFGGVL
ncbi:MAG: hypothetical protein PVF58_19075 [Candidatus Methanofastidiosia archaeon]|jgi:hypothetical protein